MNNTTTGSRAPGKTAMSFALTGAALALALGMPVGASAQSTQMLQSKIDQMEQELQSMKAEMGAMQQKATAQEMKEKKEGVKVSAKGGGITVESADGAFSGHLGGRMLLDQAFYSQDKTKLGDGSEFRSLRLDAGGKMFYDWIYKIQLDFANGGVGIKDTYLGYTGIKPLEIVGGHIIEPITMGLMTSNKYTTFMEPAISITPLGSPDRRDGGQVAARGENWTATAGVFSSKTPKLGNHNDSGFDVAARVTYAPIFTKNEVLHFGFGVQDRSPHGENPVSLSSIPESHEDGTAFVSTGGINMAHLITYVPEIAGVYGPFHAQAEYASYNVQGKDGVPDFTFDGWYVQAGFFLTGESRPYQTKDTPYSADFGRVKPTHPVGEGGFGAWEIAARYSVLDLNDKTVAGGKEDNITVGLNWYATSQIRFMLNYIKVHTDSVNAVAAHASEDPSIIQMRAQVDF